MTVAEQIAAEHTLAHTLDQFKGQYVAIRDHVVIESASTLGELRGKIEGQEDEVEILKVASEPHAACFF